MNLPADNHTGQGAKVAAAPVAESGGADAEGTDGPGSEAAGREAGAGEAVGPADDGGPTLATTVQRAATRRILDEVFGDVLPTVTRDELDDESDRSDAGLDQWYRDNRPPHHG